MNWEAAPLHQRGDLVDSIRRCHGVDATWIESIRVVSELVDGTVEVFHVEHPISTRCYAWTICTGWNRSRTFAVLDDEAVIDAASAADHVVLNFENSCIVRDA